jgi:type IV pilus assembly protein PilE
MLDVIVKTGGGVMHENLPSNLKARQRAFTLMELMIAVAIVGILAAIALPSYESYIIKSNRRAAQAFMWDVANRERQYLLDARSYTNNLTTLGMAVPEDVSRNYTVTVALTSAPPGFVVSAVPVDGTRQVKDGAAGLTLSDQGVKTPSDKW